jgi:hypothetical protein
MIPSSTSEVRVPMPAPDSAELADIDCPVELLDLSRELDLPRNQRLVTSQDYGRYRDIECLYLPLSVEHIEDGLLESYSRLIFVKCDPRWLVRMNKSALRSVLIPAGIRHLTVEQFAGLVNLTFLELPSTVHTIDPNTFSDCRNLFSVSCNIEHLEFFTKALLKVVVINGGAREVLLRTFAGCIHLEKLVLPESIQGIDVHAFADCKALYESNVLYNRNSRLGCPPTGFRRRTPNMRRP